MRLTRSGSVCLSNETTMRKLARFCGSRLISWLNTWRRNMSTGSQRRICSRSIRSRSLVCGVHGKHKVHFVELDTWKCTCSFPCAMILPCQHASSLRKRGKVAESIIPLNRIDERWLHPVEQSVTSRPFHVSEFKPGELKRKSLNAAVKYKEALSATQAICSELAYIDNDVKFHELLEFVLEQRMNVRQRKRLKCGSQTVPMKRGRSDSDVEAVGAPSTQRRDDNDVELNEKKPTVASPS